MNRTRGVEAELELEGREGLTRRTWLQSSAAAGISLFAFPGLAAQEQGFQDVVHRMSTVTGVPLPESREAAAAALVGIIIAYSKSLRAFDLGEIEPATQFVAR